MSATITYLANQRDAPVEMALILPISLMHGPFRACRRGANSAIGS
jgi:hypothetical protein